MSFIIDSDKRSYFYNFQKTKKRSPVQDEGRQQEGKKNNAFSLLDSLQKTLKHQQSCFNYQMVSSSIGKIILESQIMLSEGGGLMKFHVNDINRSISIQIEILNKSSNYQIIQNQEKRNLLNKLIMTKKNFLKENFFKINFNLNCGKISLWLPLFYFFKAEQFENESGIRRITILNKLISCIDSETKNLMKSLYEFIFQEKKIAQQSVNNNYPIFYSRQIKHLFRFNQLSNVYKKETNGIQIVTENTSRKQEIKQVQSKKYLIENEYLIPSHYYKANSLYKHGHVFTEDLKKVQACDLSQKEHDVLKYYLQVPMRNKGKSNENVNMLTEIYIKDIERVQLMPVNKGGFSQIYQTQLEFYFINNLSEVNNENFKKKSPYKNILIVKKQISTKTNAEVSKNQHEIQIIHHMRNSPSVMLNRYYMPLNKENIFKNDILMDRINITLSQFRNYCQKTISLQTRLFLALNIIQCLRSINAYNVVHLDLKLSNLMITDQLIVKLIDFGQSYHPKISSIKNFKPGFTMPYSCPQIYQRHKTFTIKSDVYSFGVILFQLIYRRFPFFIYDQNLVLQKFTEKKYMKDFYYTSEQGETYGQNLVYLILDQLIFKCLREQPEMRPELQMLALILNQCIQIIS